MKENRIYGKKIDINTENTKRFYNDRALRSDSMMCPYTAVLLGDQSAERAAHWNEYEKNFLLSEMEFSSADSVLDIGCGMGRLAEFLIPLCGNYTGADFSSEMIKLARKRCTCAERNNAEFITASFHELANHPERFGRKFSKLIIAGVCMYVNDSDLEECYRGILRCLDKHCMIYIEDTVALQTRLTLDNVASAALKSNYDAIYRTPDEYNLLFRIFEGNGLHKIKQGFFPNFDGNDCFRETDHWYTLFQSDSDSI